MSWSGYSEQGRGSQERGPGGFSLQLPGGVQRTAPRPGGEGSAETRVGIRGGEVRDTSRSYADFRAPRMTPITQQAQLPQVQAKSDPTIDFLGKVAGARMQEMVKKAQEEAFIKGAAQAASGQAMAEIVNEQPWYQGIFGDTALVEGARAYTVKAGVSKWTAENMAQMEQLAAKTPNEIPAFLQESMKKYQTGDAATDQAIQAEMLAQVPSLVKEHTKQHYATLQKAAADAHTNAAHNALERFQGYADKTLEFDPESAAQMMSDIEQTFAIQPGMNPEAHYDRIAKVLQGSAARGNFKAIAAVAGMGYLDRLAPQDQLAIEQALKRAAPGKLAQAAEMLSGELREFFLNPSLTKEDRDAAVEQLNGRAADLSGVPPEFGKLIDLDTEIKMDARTQSILDRAAAAGAKEQDEMQKQLVLGSAVKSGDPAYILNAQTLLKISDADVQRELTTQLQTQPVEEQVRMVGSLPMKVDYMVASIANDRAAILNGDKPDPAMLDVAIKRFEGLRDSGKAALYYDPVQRSMLETLSQTPWRSQNVEAALQVARLKANSLERYSERPTAEVKKAVTGVLEKDFKTGRFGRTVETLTSMIGPQYRPDVNINATQQKLLEDMVGGAIASGFITTPNAEQAAREQLTAMKAEGQFTQVGRNLIFNANPQEAAAGGDKSLAVMMGLGDVEFAHIAVDQKITALVAQHGFVEDDYLVLRLPNRNGVAQFMLQGRGEDGKEKLQTFTSDDLKVQAQETERVIIETKRAREQSAAQQIENRERGGMTELEQRLMQGNR